MKFSKFSKKIIGSTGLAACRSSENYLLSLKISQFFVNGVSEYWRYRKTEHTTRTGSLSSIRRIFGTLTQFSRFSDFEGFLWFFVKIFTKKCIYPWITEKRKIGVKVPKIPLIDLDEPVLVVCSVFLYLQYSPTPFTKNWEILSDNR